MDGIVNRDGEEPPLNEDDLDDLEEEEELNTEHLILAQFDQVQWSHTLHLVSRMFNTYCLTVLSIIFTR